MNISTFIEATVDGIIYASTTLLSSLGGVLSNVVELVYDTGNDVFTSLGAILLATAGFALAWAGIRFVFGFVNRLLNKSRAGR